MAGSMRCTDTTEELILAVTPLNPSALRGFPCTLQAKAGLLPQRDGESFISNYFRFLTLLLS
jgi:hypothetical protein